MLNHSTHQGSGVLSLDGIRAMFFQMYETARTDPDYFLVSPETVQSLRLPRLYGVNGLYATRKLRKCVMRRKYARIKQGRQRLLRAERHRCFV